MQSGSTGSVVVAMTSAVKRSALLALVVVLYSTRLVADARLVGFDSPDRSSGSFYVVFKSGAELAAVPRTGPGAPQILPWVFPTSDGSAIRIAEALCSRIQARLSGVTYSPSHAAFVVRNASDAAIREVLARDPRIAEIGANMKIRE